MPRKEIPVKGNKGIKKFVFWDEESQKYLEPTKGSRFRAVKSIKGIRTTKCFETLREAINWKNTYHPQLVTVKSVSEPKDSSPFLKDVYANYIETIGATVEKSTLANKLEKANLLKLFFGHRMNAITPDLIDEAIRKRKAKMVITSPRRCNFDRELDEFRAIINWYIENHNYKYSKPLLRRHYNLGIIKKPKHRDKKMSPKEVSLFLKSIKEHCGQFYYDLAITQFYTAGRIQEIAGLQKQCVDLTNKVIQIKYVAVWNKQKNFDYLKEFPKNDEVRYCKMSEATFESLSRIYQAIPEGCRFVFNQDGQPLKYREIQYNYEKALRACGLAPKFSGTHFLRHTMAYITRNVTGSIDYTQAVTGHKDIRYVQHYAGTPDSKQGAAVAQVEAFMNKISAEENTSARTQTHTNPNSEAELPDISWS